MAKRRFALRFHKDHLGYPCELTDETAFQHSGSIGFQPISKTPLTRNVSVSTSLIRTTDPSSRKYSFQPS
jgi:hypothetical protein